jgi:hypothetical protein
VKVCGLHWGGLRCADDADRITTSASNMTVMQGSESDVSRPSHLLVLLQLLIWGVRLSIAWCHLVLSDGRQPLIEVVVTLICLLLACMLHTVLSTGNWAALVYSPPTEIGLMLRRFVDPDCFAVL